MCTCVWGGRGRRGGDVQCIEHNYDFRLCTCVFGSLEEPVSYEGLFDVFLRALLHLESIVQHVTHNV